MTNNTYLQNYPSTTNIPMPRGVLWDEESPSKSMRGYMEGIIPYMGMQGGINEGMERGVEGDMQGWRTSMGVGGDVDGYMKGVTSRIPLGISDGKNGRIPGMTGGISTMNMGVGMGGHMGGGMGLNMRGSVGRGMRTSTLPQISQMGRAHAYG